MEKNAQIFDKIVDRRRACRLFDTSFELPEGVVRRSLERAIKSPSSSNMQLWEFYRIKSKEGLKTAAEICLNQQGAKTASEIVVFVARGDLWKDRLAVHLKRIADTPSKPQKDDKRLLTNKEEKYYGKLMPLFYNPSLSFVKDIFKRIYIWNKSRKGPFMQDAYSKFIPVVVQKSTALAAQTFMLSIAAEGYDSLPMEGLDSKRMKQFLQLPNGAQINMAIAVGKGLKEGIRGERFRLPYDAVVFER